MPLRALFQRFDILMIDRAVIQSALLLPGLDFEDNVQIACAIRDRMDLIITRNKADFTNSPVTAIEPPDIVQHLPTP